MTVAAYKKEIENLEWDFKALKPIFNGAIQTYETEDGEGVAVLFTTRKIQAFRDRTGLYTAKDIVKFIVKNDKLNHMFTNIDEGVVIANIVEEEDNDADYADPSEVETVTSVVFDDAVLESLGLDDEEIKAGMRIRAELLCGYSKELGKTMG